MPRRQLTQEEVDAIDDKVVKDLIASAPRELTEEEFNRQYDPRFAQYAGAMEQLEPREAIKLVKPRAPLSVGSALGLSASGVASQFNPVEMVKGLYGAVTDLPGTARNILGAMGAEEQKAEELTQQGRFFPALGHRLAARVPILGPAAAQIGEAIGTGEPEDVARGLGEALGLVGTVVAPSAVRGAVRATKAAVPARMAENVAAAAERGSTERFAQSMAPSGSSKEIRTMGKQAADVAQEVRRRTTSITPEGLHRELAEQLEAHSQVYDDFYKNTPASQQIGPTAPFIKLMEAKRAELARRGTGGAVFSEANADRVKALDTAINEVRRLGAYATSDQIAALRNDWKDFAKDAYVPSVNPEFRKIRGNAKGYADARSAVMDGLFSRHPELRDMNPDYHVLKQATDVMDALENFERTRPTVGRTIMSRGLGAATGAAAHGTTGGLIGAIVGPLVERGIAQNISPAVKLIMARNLGALADAIRSGAPPAKIQALASKLRPLMVAGQMQTQPQQAEGQ